MESTILPLELVFEHRNYLPMAGLLLGIVCAVAPWLASRWSARIGCARCAVLLFWLAGLTAVRAASWGNPLDARAHRCAPSSGFLAFDQYEAGRSIVIAGAMKGERAKADLEA